MTTYCIKKGRRNFRPYENPLPVFRCKGFEVSGRILPGGWCSLEDWDGDHDWKDWQKLKGITHFFSWNNHRSAMIAFRFGKQRETYELSAYTNDKSYENGWYSSGSIMVEANESFSFDGTQKKDSVVYAGASAGGMHLNETHQLNTFKLGREVGTSPQGKNNSPGPHGGRAVKAMCMELDFNIFR